jgi:hypothetical protein
MLYAAAQFDVVQQKSDREQFVKNVRGIAKDREQRSKHSQPAVALSPFANICLLLHRLAQKYVPRTAQAFRDFDDLAQATSALQRMGLQLDVAADICAPTKSVDRAVIFNSPEYRLLRNRFIAALATIADMPAKNSPPGHPEYQRGVREGYRRASDIAILFLEDVQNGTK